MTNTKHTPGPWHVTPHQQALFVWGKQNDREPCIADVNVYGRERETVQANARLIAAAPELVAAVQEALEWCGEDGEIILGSKAARDDWRDVLAARAQMLHAALTKAGIAS